MGVVVALAPLVFSDEEPATNHERQISGAAKVQPTKVFVQLLTDTEPIVAVDPLSGRARTLRFPTSGGDWLQRMARTGGRLVWVGPAGTYAIDADLSGPIQVLSKAHFVPYPTAGRLWFMEFGRDRRDRNLVQMTVRGRVTRRSTLRDPCGGGIVVAVDRALLCRPRHADHMVALDPSTGRALMRVRGVSQLAARGNTIALCPTPCDAVHVTDIANRRRARISPPLGYRVVEGYDGALSPDGALLAVPVAARGRERGSRSPLRVGLFDVRRESARVVPGSRLAADYRKATWSSSGDLFFASPRGRLMTYRPGDPKARLLRVRLHRRILALAAS